MDSFEHCKDDKDLEETLVDHSANDATTSETAVLLNGIPRDNETLEATIYKKLHRFVLPLTSIIIVFSYVDRGNLGYVAADVCTELKMSHTDYGVGVALFGVGYITSQIHSNYVLRKLGATLWFALLLLSWGIVAGSFSFVQGQPVFYLLRFLLGVTEGGTFPGVWYYLTIFFPADRLTFPYATTESATVIASPLAAPLAAALLSLDGLFGFAGWRMLFFIEGILSILFAGLLFWLLPSSIDQASFLREHEKDWLKSQHREIEDDTRSLMGEVWEVSKSKEFWIIQVNSIVRGALIMAAFYWTTLLIDDMLNGSDDDDDDDTCASSDSTSVASVLLTAVPFTICAIFAVWFGHATARVKNRPWLAGWIMAFSGLFLYGWVIFRHVCFTCALLSFSFGISCFMSLNALIIGLVGSYYGRETRATAIALFNTVNGVGMIVGPIMLGYIVDQHGYGVAVTILAVITFVSSLALLFVKDPLTMQEMDICDNEVQQNL